jgi:mono/diheme cytochrome c family protein
LHSDLELQGVKLDPLPDPPEAMGSGDAMPASGPAASTPASASGEVSFSKQVAPMLVGKCGSCHIRGDKGGFNMKNYNDLMRGSKDGTVISPKNGPDSRIVELIRTKDMPRGGGSVSDQEMALLSKWIDQGAKFDGPNKDTNLADLGASAPKTEITTASGKVIKGGPFALEIGPVLVAECFGCHAEGRMPAGQYDMNMYAGLLKGGRVGNFNNQVAIVPGNPSGSLLIKKLRGTASDGERMPKDRAPLSNETIAKIEKWIGEGAKLDGGDPSRPIREIVAVAHAESLTHEELTKERAALAAHNWKLILPDAADEHEESPNFLVYGNVGKDQLKEVAKVAEAQGAKLQKQLKLPPGPLVKGRTTIYVFDKKYEYGEVGRMLEGRELPSNSRAHWNYTVIDAYVCLAPSKSNDASSLAGTLGKELAAIVIAAQGQVPRWFAEGSARNLAIKLDAKDPRYRQWEDDGMAVLSSGFKPETVLTAVGPETDQVAYLYVKRLLSDAPRYQKLLAGVRDGAPFDAAFAAAYGSTPAQFVNSLPAPARR